MRRLALTLATALLGTGCVITDDDFGPAGRRGSVQLYWDFQKHTSFVGVPGTVPLDEEGYGSEAGLCPESAVDSVTIDTPNGAYDVSCREWNPAQGLGVQGVIIPDLPAGVQSFRIRGWRGELAAYDRTFTLDVDANAVTDYGVFTVPGRSQPLDLFAYLAHGAPAVDYASCSAAGTPNVRYRIWFGPTLVLDEVAGCSDPLPTFVFQGDLDVDYDYTVRMQGLRLSDDAVVFDSCEVGFDHLSSQIGNAGVAADLFTLPVPSCQ